MRLGEIKQLGRHRLMCGDAGNPEHVAALMDGAKADLVFTSPPYAQQRDYGQKIDDWFGLMRRVFGALPAKDETQVLVNLGLVHRDGEWQPYWDPWIEWMRAAGWKRFGWYVWDKKGGFPLDPRIGRLNQTFEFIFHFNRSAPRLRKTFECKTEGEAPSGLKIAQTDGTKRRRSGKLPTQSHRTPDDIWRMSRNTESTGHPAAFPVGLPAAVALCYTDRGELLYDPFSGSGTSIMAAQKTGRICYAMEIEPTYCHIAVRRFFERRP